MQPTRKRPLFRRPILWVLLAVLAAAIVFAGPTLAFHFLPPGVTGEDARLAALLELGPGMRVAEIGAGRGALSMTVARRVQPGGTLYSTELNADRRRQIRERAARERLSNVVIIEAAETSTGLPDACCDALFMRNVYHHIGEPAPFNRSLRRAARPGARLAIIDFRPEAFWHLASPPAGAARNRTGHGVAPETVAKELEAAGFRAERTIHDWGGRMYLVLLRVPVRE